MLTKNFSDKNLNFNGVDTLNTLINNWLSFVQLRFSENTYRTYNVAIHEFLYEMPPKSKPSDITSLHIEKYIQQLIQTKHTPKSVNTYLAAIKSFYRWAENFCQLPNQAKPVPLLREKQKHIRILSDEEYNLILRFSPTIQYHNAFQFLGNTGLRISEFRALCWHNFNADFLHIIGKGNKARYVPLNQICQRIVKNHSDIGIPPFVKCFSKQHHIYRLCARISQKANVKAFTPHSFRHYFATRLIRKGVSLTIVSKILGHANTQITEQVYVHLIPADLKVTNVLEI